MINDKKHSGSWKNSFLETFGAIYDESTWVCPNPVQKPAFQKFARNSKKADIFTSEELSRFFNDKTKWESEEVYLLFYVTAACGLRLGEARGLRVNQLMLDEQILLVNGFCKKDGFRTDYNKKGSGENKKLRLAPIPKIIAKKLNEYIMSRMLRENDFLFTDENGKPIPGYILRNRFLRMLKICRINPNGRKLCPHSLRFTYVTRMRRSLTAEDVRKIVGHNSVEMTSYYTRYSLEDLKTQMKETISSADKIFE